MKQNSSRTILDFGQLAIYEKLIYMKPLREQLS